MRISDSEIDVLIYLKDGEKNFSEIYKSGINSSRTMALNRLVQKKLITKRFQHDKSRRTFYSITELGLKVLRNKKRKYIEYHEEQLHRWSKVD